LISSNDQVQIGKNNTVSLRNGDEIHLINENDMIAADKALGFLFTVLEDISRPKVKESLPQASLSMLFEIKESLKPGNEAVETKESK
jgi:hypothetical protein